MCTISLEDVTDTFEKYIKVKHTFEFSLKDAQVNIIKRIVNKETDVFGLLPTGFGKSMCYCLPPLILDKVWFHSLLTELYT